MAEFPSDNGEIRPHDISSTMHVTSIVPHDNAVTNRLKNDVDVGVHPGVEAVQRRSEDSGGSRLSTLVDFEIGQAVKNDLSSTQKWMMLGIVAFHIIIPLTNATLAGILLPHASPSTGIRSMTVTFSLVATYFDPLAILIVMAHWDYIPKCVRVGLFTLRFAFTMTSAVLTRLDIGSCLMVDNPNGKSPCQIIIPLNVLLFVSLPILAFETLVVGGDLPKKEQGESKAMKLQSEV